MKRQAPFLKSVLQEANQHKQQELLRMANADQINGISELVKNTLRGTVPRSRHDYIAQTPCSEFTRYGQTRTFRQSGTRHHDSSNRRNPLA